MVFYSYELKFCRLPIHYNWSSVVGIVTNLWGWTAETLQGDYRQLQDISLFCKSVQIGSVAHQCVPGTLYSSVTCPRHEGDHSYPSSAEVKTDWIYTSHLPYAFMACIGTALYLPLSIVQS
jgi:hypothetical protein